MIELEIENWRKQQMNKKVVLAKAAIVLLKWVRLLYSAKLEKKCNLFFQRSHDVLGHYVYTSVPANKNVCMTNRYRVDNKVKTGESPLKTIKGYSDPACVDH